MSSQHFPQLGDEITATLVSGADDSTWILESPEVSGDWSLKLYSRTPRLYQVGDTGRFWIFRTSLRDNSAFLADSNFGRYSITDGMRPKYVLALRETIKIAKDPSNLSDIQPEHLSQMKGMFNRCIRQDQWDWLTVYDLLSRPSIRTMDNAANYLYNLGRGIRDGDMEYAYANAVNFSCLGLCSKLESALRELTESSKQLGKLLSFQSTTPNIRDDSKQEDSEEYILSYITKAKIERANSVHKATLAKLVEHLDKQGFIVEYSRLIDAFARLKSGPAVFEIKSISQENERSQCRSALSQLYEYRYLHDIPNASLWLVLSQRPTLDWLITYLEKDRDVRLIWLDNDKFQGPSIEHL